MAHILAVDDDPIIRKTIGSALIEAGQPVSTDQLLRDVWGYHAGIGDPKLVRVSITRLRAKIEPQSDAPQYIINVRGRGYLLQ